MNLNVLKSKLHQACITHADVDYEGSFGIDAELMKAVGIYPYEKVLVANINNGSRLETYVIPEPFGSRRMVLNGAAARLGSAGDRIIIMAFCQVDAETVRDGKHRPRMMRLNEHNEPVEWLSSSNTTSAFASMVDG